MKKSYKPNLKIESIDGLAPQVLQTLGKKAVLVDLDNTIIGWKGFLPTPAIQMWIYQLKKAGIHVIIISNGRKKRVKEKAIFLNVDFMANAMKPLPFGIFRILKKYNLKKEEVLLVGDQLCTDILAANRAGIDSILVDPLSEVDSWVSKFNRWREARIRSKISIFCLTNYELRALAERQIWRFNQDRRLITKDDLQIISCVFVLIILGIPMLIRWLFFMVLTKRGVRVKTGRKGSLNYYYYPHKLLPKRFWKLTV
ncbi:hypothetical protein AGMMS50249_3770 [candidate division SR1 bacterium]|nr:hypothetical protein AGMMS50249_3770 [candidate division SR1 bacterium]